MAGYASYVVGSASEAVGESLWKTVTPLLLRTSNKISLYRSPARKTLIGCNQANVGVSLRHLKRRAVPLPSAYHPC